MAIHLRARQLAQKRGDASLYHLIYEAAHTTRKYSSRHEMCIRDRALQARLVGLLARAAGHAGMAGGQAVDLASIGQRLSEAELRDMHRRKTGALLQCSVLMGAACGPAAPAAKAALEDFGAALGLAFQVVDDILDLSLIHI